MAKMFAYGDNIACGEKCPALTAEVPMEGEDIGALYVAEVYDDIVRKAIDSGEIEPIETSRHESMGLISEKDARVCWMQALRSVERSYGERYSTEAGRCVASKLGWS